MNTVADVSKKYKRSSSQTASQLFQCIETIQKPTNRRLSRDNERIIPYLMSLKEFLHVFKTENDKIIQELIRGISLHLTYTFINKKDIIFRYGEKGDKYYIILQGDVAVLTPITEKVYMSEEEYLLYLLKLRKNNEIELLNKCIGLNNGNFLINENFDIWVKSRYFSQYNLSSRNSGITSIKRTSKKSTNLLLKTDTELSQKGNSSSYSNDMLERIKDTLEYVGVLGDSPQLTGKETYSIEDYVNMNQVELLANVPIDSRKLITIFTYQHVNTLSTGGTFGDIALETKAHKRTATLIAMTDTHVGVLEKFVYDKLLKAISEKSKKMFLNLIFSYPIFHNIPKSTFEQKYYHLFKYKRFRRGEKLVTQNSPGEAIYFIKSGEYEIYTHKNILEVNDLLSQFHKKIISCNGDDPTTPSNALPYLHLIAENAAIRQKTKYRRSSYNKVFFEKKIIRLGIIKDREVVGLDECFNSITKEAVMSVECLSNSCEAFLLSRESFNFITSKENSIQENIDKFIVTKIKFFIDRLCHYKKTQLQDFHRNEYMDKEEQVSKQPHECGNEGSSPRMTEVINSKVGAGDEFTPIKSQRKNNLLMKQLDFEKIQVFNKVLHSNRAFKSKNLVKSVGSSSQVSKERKETNQNSVLLSYKVSILEKNRYNELFKTFLNYHPVNTGEESTLYSQSHNSVKNQKYFSTRTPVVKSSYGRNFNLNYIDCLIKDKLDCYYSALSSSRRQSLRPKIEKSFYIET